MINYQSTSAHYFYNKKLKFVFILLCSFLVTTSCKEKEDIQKADIIISNANIWTGNKDQIRAQAMAILGDSIVEIGTNEAVEKYKSANTKIIDVKGKFITPGFIDCHIHLMGGGNGLLSIDLRDASTPEEFSKRIIDFSKTIDPKTWVLEGNWDHTLWGGELPKKEWIDEGTKDIPVAVSRLDGHMLLANSAALKFAGIDKNTPNVEGGEIVKDKNGELTGILKDNAMNLIFKKMPPLSEERKEKNFKAAMKYLLSNGITSVHDVDGLSSIYESYSIANKLKEKDELSIRIYTAKPLANWGELEKMNLKSDKWLKVGLLKGFVDGSLGSHTAAFLEPYTDKKDDKGFFVNSKEDLYKWVSQADKAGIQIAIHAIGDEANKELLNIYERVIAENGKKDRRFRIEHAQHIAKEDFKRFAELNVIPSVQPYHAIDDGRWAESIIGSERIKTTYAFKSFLDANATLVFGSDWAVAPAPPILGIYAAVTRQTLDDKNPDGWVPEQKITVEQALTAYTKNAAYASFDEKTKGTLAVGKLADFVILSEDLTKIDPNKIKDVKVLETYVGGKKKY